MEVFSTRGQHENLETAKNANRIHFDNSCEPATYGYYTWDPLIKPYLFVFHVKLRIYNTYYVPGSRYRYRLQYVDFSAPGV